MSLHDVLPIELEELTLRRVELCDCSDLFEIYSNLDVARYELFDPWTFEQVEDLLSYESEVDTDKPTAQIRLVAVLRSEDRIIGDCQITIDSVVNQQGEIGFAFNPKYSGRGFATKAVNATLGFGFRRLNLHRITASTDVRNERSWRLMERLGMRREAHFIHKHLVHGEWVDDYLYAILEEEWRAKNCN